MHSIRSYQIMLTTLLVVTGIATAMPAHASPTPEVARKCLTFSYRVYPYKRPGSVKGSNARRDYLAECIAKNGQVDEPPMPTASAKPAPAPKAN